MRLIVDGDIVAFMAVGQYPDDLDKAVERAEEIIKDVSECCFTTVDDTVVYVKGDSNFRDDYGDYKIMRDPSKRPATLEPVRAYLGNFYGGFAHGGEADDYCLIEAERCVSQGIPFVIATTDKDLRQFPGIFFNLRTQEFQLVSEQEGYDFLLQQCLMGDATDGIQGLKGIGPKKSRAYLDENKGKEEPAILEKYQSVYGQEKGAAELAKCWNLVFIRRKFEDLKILELPEVFYG